MKSILFIAVFIEILIESRINKTRLINAALAQPGQFNFMVGLFHTINNETSPMCSGTLVTWINVLTAANCVDGTKGARYCVMGATDINRITVNNNGNPNIQIRKIKHTSHHPLFKPGEESNDNDIAVITVDERFQRTDFVSIIKTPTNQLERNNRCIGVSYADTEYAYKMTPDGVLQFEHVLVNKISVNSKTYTIATLSPFQRGTYEGGAGGPLVDPDLMEVHGVRAGNSCRSSTFMNVFAHRYYVWEQLNYYTEQRLSGKLNKSISIRIRFYSNLMILVFVSALVETFPLRF